MVLPFVSAELKLFMVEGKALHAVTHAVLSGHSVLQVAATMSQNPSQVVPHAPPPEGPACGQCSVAAAASAFAAPAWYVRQPSVSPDISALAPGGNVAAEPIQLFMSAYCALAPVQFASTAVQYAVTASIAPLELLELPELLEPELLEPEPLEEEDEDELPSVVSAGSLQPTASKEPEANKKPTRRILVLVIREGFHFIAKTVKCFLARNSLRTYARNNMRGIEGVSRFRKNFLLPPSRQWGPQALDFAKQCALNENEARDHYACAQSKVGSRSAPLFHYEQFVTPTVLP